MNLIIQDHAKHIHHYEVDMRSLRKKTDVRHINFFVLLFFFYQ